MDIGGNSGPCFVCGRSSHDFVDSLVTRSMTQRVHISISNLTNGCPGLVSETWEYIIPFGRQSRSNRAVD
jgi:hypothetical protein